VFAAERGLCGGGEGAVGWPRAGCGVAESRLWSGLWGGRERAVERAVGWPRGGCGQL